MGVLIVLDTFEGDAILRKRQKPRSKLTRTSASQSPRTVQYASNCSTHDAPGSTTVLPPFKSVQSTKFFFRHKNHFSSPVQGRRSVIIVSSLRRLPPPPSSLLPPAPIPTKYQDLIRKLPSPVAPPACPSSQHLLSSSPSF